MTLRPAKSFLEERRSTGKVPYYLPIDLPMRFGPAKLLTLAVATTLAACSSDSTTSPAATPAPPGTAAALTVATIDKDIAATVGAAVITNLDAFVSSDVMAGLSASIGVHNLPPSLSDLVGNGEHHEPSDTVSVDSTPDGHPGEPSDSAVSDSGEHTAGDSASHHEPGHEDPAGTPPSAPPQGGSPCARDNNHHRTECEFFSHHAEVNSTVVFVDAHGDVTNTFIPGTTDTIRTTLVMARIDTNESGRRISHIARNLSKAVGGFLEVAGDRTTNGVGIGADTTTITDSGYTRIYAGASADTVSGLTFAEHRWLNPYPKSGTTISRVDALITVVKNGETTTKTISRRVVVTFDGSATASLQVGSTVCQLHLDTRTVDSCHE